MAGATRPRAIVTPMGKALLVSIVVVPLVVARRSAGLRNPRLGLRRTVISSFAFGAFYILALVYLYSRLG